MDGVLLLSRFCRAAGHAPYSKAPALGADLESPPAAPSGFTGASNEGVINTTFSLWTLHAWIGMENPDGVFASHTPQLH